MFEPPEALPFHTLSKLHYLIHEPCLTNHLSFLELLNCETHCRPLLSLNPTICDLLNLTSTNLIWSPFLLKLKFFLCRGLVIGPTAFPRHYLLKKEKKPVIDFKADQLRIDSIQFVRYRHESKTFLLKLVIQSAK